MSIFIILSITFITLSDLLVSLSCNISPKTVGTICHDTLYLSFNYPHCTSSPPSVSLSHRSSISCWISQFTTTLRFQTFYLYSQVHELFHGPDIRQKVSCNLCCCERRRPCRPPGPPLPHSSAIATIYGKAIEPIKQKRNIANMSDVCNAGLLGKG